MVGSLGTLPLAGVKVIDLGQVYQGPYATYLMARAGAEVIKIEPPGGEPVRRRTSISRGSAVPFAMLNGNKKSVSLDLKNERGRELLIKLASRADVLLENFAPGAMDRLGIGWKTLSARNPRLVYASGSGYGLSGPDAGNLAMDLTVQAASGVMSVTGFAGNDPVKAGPAIADFLGGIHLYAGVMTALYERALSGRGRMVEVAMQEALYPTFASNLGMMYDSGTPPPRTGNRHGGLSVSPYNVYAASDGHFAVIVLNDEHWVRLARAMATPQLAIDPRFATGAQRVEHIDLVDDLISDWGRGLSRDQALARLREHAVPSAPVRDLVEVTNDPHMHARGMLNWLDHSEFGRIAIPDSPIRLHGAQRLPLVESPRLGADNVAVLTQELGLSLLEIEGLQSAGVLGRAAPDPVRGPLVAANDQRGTDAATD